MATSNSPRGPLWHAERGKGTPLVLLHAFPADHRVFDAQVEALSSQFRVIAPDLRGFGQSKGDEPFTLESQADEVHALLTSIGALPCVLGGLSMGGYVALAFAANYPADLLGLVLIDSKAEADAAEARAGREKIIALARAAGAKGVADQMLPKMFASATAESQPAVVARLREMMEACPPRTIEYASIAMRDRPDRTQTLASLDVPVLAIVGAEDAIIPPDVARANSGRAKHGTCEVIAGAGHMSLMEQPTGANKALAEFAASIDDASR